jgi:multidrug efflux pump
VDREKAKALGVPISMMPSIPGGTLGTYYVNDFNKYRPCLAGADVGRAQFRHRPGDIGSIYVRSNQGRDGAVVGNSRTSASAPARTRMDRYNNLPAVKLIGQGRPAFPRARPSPKSNALVPGKVLPPDFSYDWGGASFQEKKSSGTSGLALIMLAAIMVFLILAAQYEKWSLPLSVMMAAALRHVRGAGRGVPARLHE